jgi:hypothetical protein
MELPMLLNSLLAATQQLHVVLTTLQTRDNGAALYVETGVGRHIRHASDHLQALLDSSQTHSIDYNFRTRDSDTEKSIESALALLARQRVQLTAMSAFDLHSGVKVISEISFSATLNGAFQSSLAREMLYLINHTIHHAAYIKLVLKNKGVTLPDEIGLAPCTLSHMKAQNTAHVA